ncbi:MAG TPA: ribosome biogenesis GTP-binding protein YihA/YsxC [Nitrospinota bacterium]|jgi:GTP-binding protein|nr:ribosome biogenesis GTP-binding protein YihA/YsxC [Nitrospinota bacterium]|tara:strand:+ start:25067 stop:25660 length:594 start_codon:yes stop_codon:yes gene_type:complete
MKVTKAEFVTSATKKEQYPISTLPEIAFAGRSNVGKSSLINSLTGHKGLVKVSKTPGKTRLLNFFTINGCITFLDMPGYGFAKVPKSVKANWGQMVENYLVTRNNLRGVIFLLDCRRKPNEDDRIMLNWLNLYKTPFIIVFTKIDKIQKTRRIKHIREAMEELKGLVVKNTSNLRYSSLTGEGKQELWKEIAELVSH